MASRNGRYRWPRRIGRFLIGALVALALIPAVTISLVFLFPFLLFFGAVWLSGWVCRRQWRRHLGDPNPVTPSSAVSAGA